MKAGLHFKEQMTEVAWALCKSQILFMRLRIEMLTYTMLLMNSIFMYFWIKHLIQSLFYLFHFLIFLHQFRGHMRNIHFILITTPLFSLFSVYETIKSKSWIWIMD
jgi:hypothetical protein